jgi:hypothetical protein
MSTTKPILPVLTLRRGVLLAIAVCLLFHFLLFSGYLDSVWRHFSSGDVVFAVGLLAETLVVFCILYRTPLLLQKPGRLAAASRVVGLVVLAHCFVLAVMMAVAILWFVACAVLGLPARNA